MVDLIGLYKASTIDISQLELHSLAHKWNGETDHGSLNLAKQLRVALPILSMIQMIFFRQPTLLTPYEGTGPACWLSIRP